MFLQVTKITDSKSITMAKFVLLWHVSNPVIIIYHKLGVICI